MAGPIEKGASGDLPSDTAPAARDWSDDRERSLRLWITLARCYSTYSRAVAGRLVEHGLTTPQFGVLEALYHVGPLPLGTLAEKLLVTGGNVTYVMDRLEEQGLVVRARSPEDRRVVEARLTKEGRRVISEVFPSHAAFIEQLAGHLEIGEQEELRNLLRKLGVAIAITELGREHP
jgi:MarR family 2-MHQ and catechol resistance regulon transcriptional repressor